MINQGNIRANGQGGFVVLAGAQASNEGSLQASSGVALAAGETVSLALDNNQLLTVKVDGAKLKALVQNKGIILADGGAVYLTAAGRDTLLGTVVNNEGVIQARGVSSKQGRIILSGFGGDVVNTGKLDVSGKAKGTKGGLVALNG
ncbi:MAG: filamentous hemagglutinin, partial [Methylocystaceae bacterium]|nr:filamentous hemagglutinin [Methylocystaceae bacterium]